jgi:hypothetical protein
MAASKAASAPATRAFKKLYCDLRTRIFRELSGAELKVWLYHYLRSNGGDVSRPGIKLISADTGLTRETVINARSGLIAREWLVPAETKSKFKARTLRAAVPAGESENPTPPRPQKAGKKHTPETIAKIRAGVIRRAQERAKTTPQPGPGTVTDEASTVTGNIQISGEHGSGNPTGGGSDKSTSQGSDKPTTEVDTVEVGSTGVEKTKQDTSLPEAMTQLGSPAVQVAKNEATEIPRPPKAVPCTANASFAELPVWETQYIDNLFIAARVLKRKFGRDGVSLAAYICAHALTGSRKRTGIAEWPRSTKFYMKSARAYLPDGDISDVQDGLDGGIYPFMIADADDRLRRAIEATGDDPEGMIETLDELRRAITDDEDFEMLI